MTRFKAVKVGCASILFAAATALWATLAIAGTASLTLLPTTLPVATQGTAYSQTITAIGGTAPYTFAISSGTLPSGLTLSSAGVIGGTPGGAGSVGSFTFIVQATDTNGNTGFRTYTLNSSAALTVNPATLPNGTNGTAYNQTVTASGGAGPYTFAVTSGALPAGLTLASDGTISGTPSGGGSSTFTIQATDSANDTGSRSYTVNIGTNSLTVNPANLPNGTQGTPYGQTVSASNGTGPYTFAVTAGALPAGLALNANTGAISGTPSANGVSTFTIQATDAGANTGSRAYSVTIGAAPLAINPASLPPATQGTAYNQTIVASGGTAPYSYAIVGGALPAGLALNAATGVISGTPTVNGAFGFTVQATDATPNTGTRAYTLNVGTNSLVVNPATLPAGTHGVAYSQTLSVTGGTGPFTFAITSGTLPAGLTLNTATGVISGTPSGSGIIANFTVGAADGNGDAGSRSYALSIGTNTLVVNPASLPAAVQGVPYNQTFLATGGTAPYTYAIIAGALPPGLTLNAATGVISGTPTGIGSFSVTIQAHDANGDIGSRVYAAFQVRGNPATDPDVQALVAAQAATARRFSSTQVSNVTGHLEDLHDHFDPCLINGGFGVTMYDPNTGQPVGVAPATPTTPATAQLQPFAGQSCDSRGIQPLFALWSSGTAQFGSANANSGGNDHFSTGGLTIGADGRINDGLTIGGAIGYGSDQTNLGSDGTNSGAQNFDAIAYGSFQPVKGWFIDALAGYGTLSYDNQRFDSLTSTSVTGKRSGTMWFGSLGLSTDMRSGALLVSPYLRADVMAASLQSYAEQGVAGAALTYGSVNFNSAAAVAGLRGSYDVPTSWGVLSPTARLEYRRELDGGFNQSMYYSDLGPSQSYLLNEPDAATNMVTAAVGLRARAGTRMFGEVEYGATAGDNSLLVQSVRATLRVAF
jgi:uncharacterized protein YhjY with autotransporter beta-barrel domain